ncbi:M3 family metallopeptidase [Paraburkholderia bonniea]|uniref:M3 family metallopeptidase n=1 Tax=Paraburkholderia bonniea TaxID=2152891 RepID=UPI0025746622|nr:M3 family metallopeptidase [Paraburkholderia bonniea]WJF91141.1 M3 family metallopeptidase [Paraburkholderia bonniea]WJF94456.1 M3 family metallopeptidase [Paraburkholderia bonniea]
MSISQPASGNPLNPLLDFSDLPRFGEIRPEHVTPALDVLLAAAQTAVERASAPATPASWADVVEPVERATEPLARAWGIVGHLNAVADTPELRATYGENLPRVTEFWSSVGQNLALYEKYKALKASIEFETLSHERKKILDNAVRDFRLSGAELPEEQKPRFAELQERQATLAKSYSDHVLDATNAYAYFVQHEPELAGLPEDAIAAAREAAERDGKTGWKFTLHFPSYFPVMQYAEHRPMRETLYRAYVTRASEQGVTYGGGQPEWDNTGNIAEQLALRAEEAKMLGYANFAEVSLASKMAQSPAEVMRFLDDLAVRARPHAEQDWRELREFAASELGLSDLQPWDMTFAAERLRQQRYAFSENEVKQYFPEDAVLKGLFKVTETLFDVRIRPDTATVWHPDVRFFRVERQDGALIAQFYLDLYAREGKRGGAWMDDARTRRRHAQGVQTPVAYLTCNFSAPVGGKPACFTHDEVITLFHEFGHGLHHMLTRVDESGVSGINGVEWDAVELPSQFMENFCWEWDVLSDMTSHVETAAPLPRALFDKMLAAKNFQSGLGTLRQIVFSMTDMRLHVDFDPAGPASALELAREINQQYHVIPQAEFSRWLNTFSHIFAGGYAAGYYSYKWAEVLSADAYAAFEEAAQAGNGSVLDSATGTRYRQEILEVGGSRPAMESFKAFRGREPNVDALLRHNGMSA